MHNLWKGHSLLVELYSKLEALAEGNRLKILDLFNDVDELTPTMICTLTGISTPLYAHHSQVLKRAGFITIRKSGRMRIVTRNAEAFREVSNVLHSVYAEELEELRDG
ncbi:hypothetical protein LCGC14_1112510 [marine sediment metagenome]|uniref:HTH arsR-type domain-containing protein n=1 Tax=marine sediment metagenome TaxID=412755 RepID=A0A0F9MB29_9ZZZZ